PCCREAPAPINRHIRAWRHRGEPTWQGVDRRLLRYTRADCSNAQAKHGLRKSDWLELERCADDRAILNDVEYEAVMSVVNAERAITDHHRRTWGERIANTAHDVPHQFGTGIEAADDPPTSQVEFRAQIEPPFQPDHRIDPGRGVVERPA